MEKMSKKCYNWINSQIFLRIVNMLSTMGITQQTIPDIAQYHGKEDVAHTTDSLRKEKIDQITKVVKDLLHSLDDGASAIASWEESLKILGQQRTDQEESRVARIMRDVLQDRIYLLAGGFKAHDQKVKDAAINAGLKLERESPGVWSAYKRAFWDTSSGPMPRQTVADWANRCAIIGGLVGIEAARKTEELVLKRNITNASNLPADISSYVENEQTFGSSTSQEFVTKVLTDNRFLWAPLGYGIGYMVGTIAGTAAVTYRSYSEMIDG